MPSALSVRTWWVATCAALLVAVAGCTAGDPSPSGAAASASATDVAESRPASAAPSATAVATASATPEPPLSLPIAAVQDPRQVTVSVATDVPADAGGVITVTVTSAATELIDELVVRWPADLAASLVLSPRLPDPDLVREGGGNLVVPWTKWVLGPGEQGEPPGTVSLGYGPLDAGATLTIPLYVSRVGPGPIAFDLQVLAGETILTLPEGGPAELRVEVP
jgi:hypothetical protein